MSRRHFRMRYIGSRLGNLILVAAVVTTKKAYVVIVVLVAATPFAVAEFLKTGELYLLSRRFVDDMVARLHGHWRLRFIFQPTVAILLGGRDGTKDVRLGAPPFLWGLAFRSVNRRALIRSALISVRNLVAVAILLDVISQAPYLRNYSSWCRTCPRTGSDRPSLCLIASADQPDRTSAAASWAANRRVV